MWKYEDLKKHKSQFLEKVEAGEIKADTVSEEGPIFTEELVRKTLEGATDGYNKHSDLFGNLK